MNQSELSGPTLHSQLLTVNRKPKITSKHVCKFALQTKSLGSLVSGAWAATQKISVIPQPRNPKTTLRKEVKLMLQGPAE